MAGPIQVGRLPERICPECKKPFLPKRKDTVLCSSECRTERVRRQRHEENARKLKTINCVICNKPFKQTRSNQECCSKKCNDAKQKRKHSEERRAELDSETRKCKNRTCQKSFTPNRGNQLFCSERCADIAGKRDYKDRNPEFIKQIESKRLKHKYSTDKAYRDKAKKKVINRYHALSPAEKTERNRINLSQRDPEKLREYFRIYMQERTKNDVEFRITQLLRSRTRAAIRDGKGLKQKETLELLGNSIEKTRQHIEQLFIEDMNWENWSPDGWHLDHIRPCSSFNLKEEAQQFVCFNYRNLMPVWSFENLSKNDAYEPEDEVEWARRMRDLGYDGELFLLFEEGRGGV